MPEHLVKSSRKNSAKCGCLYYAGQWQELVFDGNSNPELLAWVRDILTD